MYTEIKIKIDNAIDRTTIYRMVLYVLIGLLTTASLLSLFGLFSFGFLSIIASAAFLTAVSLLSNKIFSDTFKAPTNVESVYITALILALIISPAQNINGYVFLFWAAFLATASKYILAINKKHIFNPAAIAVVLTSYVIGQSASWWVGTGIMTPFVIAGGILIVRKIRRVDMVYTLIVTVIITTFILTALAGSDVLSALWNILFISPLAFFAFIMFTEPLTSPPTKNLQILYGILVGILVDPQFHILGFYFTPELALVIGNIYSYLVSPNEKLLLYLKEKIQRSPDTFDFVFKTDKMPKFKPGQYMEWTLPHKNTDIRGNRRYFTIASSPTEDLLRLGVKFYQDGSSFKKKLFSLDSKSPIVGSQLAGDFTLPPDKQKKLVFIAGGIGITPFRSMIKYLLDKNESRSIIVLYSNKSKNEIIYQDVFSQANRFLNIKTVYTLTDINSIPSDWQGKIGRINSDMIKSEVPDFLERTFYLSGPHNMVEAFKEVLSKMGVLKTNIKTDFFPGFA